MEISFPCSWDICVLAYKWKFIRLTLRMPPPFPPPPPKILQYIYCVISWRVYDEAVHAISIEQFTLESNLIGGIMFVQLSVM